MLISDWSSDVCSSDLAAVRRLEHAHPGLEIIALGQDFHHALTLPKAVPAPGRLFFYPGSSIGNLDPGQASAMLARLREACDGGRSEERRVGKECVGTWRSRRSPDSSKKKQS